MGKLTNRTIEAPAPREIDYIAWDDDVPGFGVLVMPSGRKSFVLQYRTGRRSRRMVLGYVNVVTPEQARGMAIQHLAALRPAIAAVRLLILTGCRLNEIMTLKWEHVDLDAAVLNLPDSKTGAKSTSANRRSTPCGGCLTCLATHG